jgi:hypothetical protein
MLLRYLKTFIAVSVILGFQACEKQNTTETCVVINELMALNSLTQPDQNGEYDDWIELANKCDLRLDLSGYYLSDSKSRLDKWRFPDGTSIPAGAYLIIWADGDTLQNGLHTGFKLSAEGENLYFSTPDLLIIDKVEYPAQAVEMSYSRNPDKTGNFTWQTPTFSASNSSFN